MMEEGNNNIMVFVLYQVGGLGYSDAIEWRVAGFFALGFLLSVSYVAVVKRLLYD